MPPDVAVVIPTYQEIDNLETVVDRVRTHGLRLLIVDDASPDGTGDLADRIAAADPGVSVVHRARKGGLGPAYAEGFAAAMADSAEIVCQMDADLSHDPDDLPRLIDAIVAGGDVALGSRYVSGGATAGWPMHRRVISRLGNRYVRLLMRIPVADATSGMRAYRSTVLNTLDPGSTRASGYAFQVEMTVRAHRAGNRIVEVPIVFTERRLGSSKMTLGIAVEAMWLVTCWGVAWRWERLRTALSSGTP